MLTKLIKKGVMNSHYYYILVEPEKKKKKKLNRIYSVNFETVSHLNHFFQILSS